MNRSIIKSDKEIQRLVKNLIFIKGGNPTEANLNNYLNTLCNAVERKLKTTEIIGTVRDEM